MSHSVKRTSKTRSYMKTFALAWTLGLVFGITVWVLKKTGYIEVKGFSKEKFALQEGKGVVVYHRHPSLLETVVIPALFFPSFLWKPFKSPLSVPDKKKFYDPKWICLLRVVFIPMPRGNRIGEGKALFQMKEELQKGRTVIVALEGGRTRKGDSFIQLNSDGIFETWERAAQDKKVDLSGTVIRRFRGVSGIQRLADGEQTFLPVWVKIKEGLRRGKMLIIFGDPVSVPSNEDAANVLERRLLETANG